MPTDATYSQLPRPQSALEHQYGEHVHILSHPWAMSLLSQLCAEETHQPRVNQLVQALYDWLLTQVASREFSSSVSRL